MPSIPFRIRQIDPYTSHFREIRIAINQQFLYDLLIYASIDTYPRQFCIVEGVRCVRRMRKMTHMRDMRS